MAPAKEEIALFSLFVIMRKITPIKQDNTIIMLSKINNHII